MQPDMLFKLLHASMKLRLGSWPRADRFHTSG